MDRAPEPSPFKSRTKVTDAKIVRWRADHELASGLSIPGHSFPRHKSIQFPGDISIAEAEAGPIVVARPSNRSVVMGFHSGRSDIRFDLVTPLLLANVLRWFEPDVFRAYDLHGGSAGTSYGNLDDVAIHRTSTCSEIRSNCPSRSKAGRCGFLRAHRRRCASSAAAGSRCTPYLCRRSRPQVGSRPDPPSVDCPAHRTSSLSGSVAVPCCSRSDRIAQSNGWSTGARGPERSLHQRHVQRLQK